MRNRKKRDLLRAYEDQLEELFGIIGLAFVEGINHDDNWSFNGGCQEWFNKDLIDLLTTILMGNVRVSLENGSHLGHDAEIASSKLVRDRSYE